MILGENFAATERAGAAACHRPRLLAVLAFEVLGTKPSVESEAAKLSQIALETVSAIDILAAAVFVLHKKVIELS